MNNRSAGPRSFNTLQRSNRAARLRRLQEARILLLAICALILLLALTGLVFLFCHIGHSVGGGTSSGGKSGKIVYGELSVLPTSEEASVSIYRGNLILVNKDHPYHFPTTRIENLSDAEKESYSVMTYRTTVGSNYPFYVLPNKKNYYMMPEAARAISRLLTDHYNLYNEALLLNEGYQTEAEQSGSNYDQLTGLSAEILNDVSSPLKDDSRARLIANGGKYGFIQRFPEGKSSQTGVGSETGVFRYVGIPHASYMTNQNLSLEEYIALLQTSYNYSDSHLLLDTSGNVVTKNAAYEIYYVAASGESATVPVPKNYRYTISGDNVGGFIITVDLNSPVA